MPDEDLCEVVFIISRAGTMEPIWTDTAAAFNQLISHQKSLRGSMQLTLAVFDRYCELLYNGVDLRGIKPLRNLPYTPGGENALLDAAGTTLQTAGERLGRTPDEKKPAKVLAVIVTESHDRISIEFTYKQIARMIRNQEQEHGWEFILASAGEDPQGMAYAFSIEAEDAYSFAPTGPGIRKLLGELDERIALWRSREPAAVLGMKLTEVSESASFPVSAHPY